MFFGTTPPIISQWLFKEIARIKPGRVLVPFSGNFVIEQLCGLIDKNIDVHCTDVSLYSRALGHYFSGEGSEIRVLPETIEEFPGLALIEEPERSAVAVVLLGEVAKAKTKPHIPYYVAMVTDARVNSEKYCFEIQKKLQLFKSNLGRFHFYGTDGIGLVNEAKANDLVFYDPPVLLGDYEKMYKELEAFFSFDTPQYTQMTDAVKEGNLTFLDQSGAKVYYRRNHIGDIQPPYHEVFRYQYKYHAAYCVFSNTDATLWVGRWKPIKEDPKNIPIISATDEITEKSEVFVVHTKSSVANHYRLMWVKKAEMADAGDSFLVFVDKKLIGCIVLMSGMTFGHDMAVILSDPAAPTSKYKRLSKLILSICCTQEMPSIFNERNMWQHNGFTTRVFTNAAVSMKYRSMFDLAERKPDKDGHFDNILIYQNRKKILPTFNDGLKKWLKQDSNNQK